MGTPRHKGPNCHKSVKSFKVYKISKTDSTWISMDASAVVRAPIVKWHFVFKVYVMLLLTVFFAMLGPIVRVWFEPQGVGTGINFIVFVWWIKTINTERWFLRGICIIIASILFGATIGSLLDQFYHINQWYIVSFFTSGIFLFTHHVLALCTREFNLIGKINVFALPFFISFFVIPQEAEYIIKFILVVPFIWYVLLWWCRDIVLVWKNCILIHINCIYILSICFKYPFLYLVYIYVFALFILYHLITHTRETIRLSSSYPEGDLSVTGTCITFYTGILGHTISHVIYFARIIFGLVSVGSSAIFMQIWPASSTYVKAIQDVITAAVTLLKEYLVRLACDVIVVFVFVVCFTVYVTNRVQG